MVRPAQQFYEFGPFRIDLTKRHLLRDGEVVPLTPKAFDTLIVLIEGDGELVEKDVLMKRVWPDSFVEEGNLTYNIYALRKALGERPGENQYIVTVQGRGYRFVPSVMKVPDEHVDLIVTDHTRMSMIVEETDDEESEQNLNDKDKSQVISVVKVRSNLLSSLRRARVFIPITVVALALLGSLLWLRAAPHQPSPQAMYWYNEGVRALRDSTYYNASKVLEKSIAEDDKFVLAHARLAEAYAELDYSDKASREILRARSLVRDLSPLPRLEQLYLQAITHVVLREFAPAIESYQEITRQVPEAEKPRAYVDLGRVYEKNEDIEKAIESYEEATRLAPAEASAFLHLGVLYGRQQDLERAQEAFQKAEDLYQALSNYEGVTEVFYQRGFLLVNLDKLPESRTQLERVLDMTKTTTNQYQQIRAMLALSSVCVSEGNVAQAERHATKAIELAQSIGIENQATGGLVWLGNSFLARGDYSNADKYYQQALELARKDNGRQNEAMALIQLGSLRTLQHDTDAGAHYIEQSLPFLQQAGYRKWLSLALTLLGRAYRDKGDYEAALAEFNNQLRLAEQANDLAQVALSHEEIGSVLSMQEQYPEALRRFDEDYKINKRLNVEMYVGYAVMHRGHMLWQIGRYEEAKAALDEATAIAKRTEGTYKQLLASIYSIIARIELSNWRFQQSEASSRQALDLAGTQYKDTIVQTKCALGLAQVRSGAPRAGKLLCEEAVDIAMSVGEQHLISGALLALAEALLEDGEPQRALEIVLRAQESFTRFGQQDSEWRGWLIAARASQRLGKDREMREYASNAKARFSSLEQRWGQEAYNGYMDRPDIQYFRKQLGQLLKLQL